MGCTKPGGKPDLACGPWFANPTFFKEILFIYFGCAGSLSLCRVLPSCGKWELLFMVVAASLVAKQGL